MSDLLDLDRLKNDGGIVVATKGQVGTGRSIPRAYHADFLLRPFVVSVEGFSDSQYHATSRARALADAWNSYCGSQDPVPFGRFMQMAKVAAGEPGPRFGERITVGGRDAFYVGENGHYVQFALPGARCYSNSHPADVTSVTGEPFTR